MHNDCGRCADRCSDCSGRDNTCLAVYDNIISRTQLINMNYLPHGRDTRRYIQRNNVMIIIIQNYDIVSAHLKTSENGPVQIMHTVPYTITTFYGRVEIMFLAGIKHVP